MFYCMHAYVHPHLQTQRVQATRDRDTAFKVMVLSNSIFFFIPSCIFWISSHEHYTVTKGKVLNAIKNRKYCYHQYCIICTCNIISNILTLFRQISIIVDHTIICTSKVFFYQASKCSELVTKVYVYTPQYVYQVLYV